MQLQFTPKHIGSMAYKDNSNLYTFCISFEGTAKSRTPDSYSKTHLRGLKGQFPPICDPFHGFKDLYRLS